MIEMPKRIIARCGVCGEEKEFIRIVEAHVVTESFDYHRTQIGVPLNSWVQTIVLPIAYCPYCKVVIYVGPSKEDVEAEFEQRKKEFRKAKARNLA